MKKTTILLLAIAAVFLAIPAQAAQSGYVWIMADGVVLSDVDLFGYPAQCAEDVSDAAFEVLQFTQTTSQKKNGGVVVGAFSFTKRINSVSPLLAKALTNSEPVSGEMHFYRPRLDGSGECEHFYTMIFDDAKIVGIEESLPNILNPALGPPQEKLRIVAGSITWEFVDGGISHTY